MSYSPKDGFPYYLDLVKDMDSKTLFSSLSTIAFLKSIPGEKGNHRYAPGKWSIKQIVGHLTDHERIKIFRAFLMSRNEQVQLWGYNQDFLVKNSRFDALTIQQLLIDHTNVRQASVSFIETLSVNQLKLKGFAGQYEVTLEDFLKSIIGHEIHHINIIKEKYS